MPLGSVLAILILRLEFTEMDVVEVMRGRVKERKRRDGLETLNDLKESVLNQQLPSMGIRVEYVAGTIQ